MIASIELQVISKILTEDDTSVVDKLCSYGREYYSVFNKEIDFILSHREKYNDVPDVFTFQSEFPNVELVRVDEKLDYLESGLRNNRKRILLVETFNKIKDLGSEDASDAWTYLASQCSKVEDLSECNPLDVVKDARQRADTLLEYSKQTRIPTGFDEIDKLMYGGLSTVEELLLIVARTNTGKSWVCTKMMESAQSHGFNVLYYSPEMQSVFLGARFDTWRGHFQNSQLIQGKYDAEYINYLKSLQKEEASAYILEDKDVSEGIVNANNLSMLVKRLNIKLLIIDGLSYMEDTKRSDTDYTKYKNICSDLFRLSKRFGCAVVVAMQANRETRECKDDKGEPFPNLYNVEGSDHPARIATQAFALRQVFDKHVLDIRLEKARSANNQRPVFSYSWDVNTGNMQYLPSDADTSSNIQTPVVSPNIGVPLRSGPSDIDLDDDSDDIEF